MSVTLRPLILELRESLVEGRRKIRASHDAGTPGAQICHALTDLADHAVQAVFRKTVEDLDPQGKIGLAQSVALVPHGGYGRRDMAPHSDVDLMILHGTDAAELVAPLAQRLLRDLFDIGLIVGQSVRTVSQACNLAREDATILTSLCESRFLVGSEDLFARFTTRFNQQMRRGRGGVLRQIVAARLDERNKFGETVYLLEPNVKRSSGALRDLQMVRWLGSARYGVQDIEGLRMRSLLSEIDYRSLKRAHEFLLRLRNEMHFHADKAIDSLERVEQLRIAEVFGYHAQEGLLPVEVFMRDYFRLTSAVSDIVSRFAVRARSQHAWQKLAAPLWSHRFEGDFLVGPGSIAVSERAMPKITGSLAQILRLCDVANLYDKPIHPETMEAIHAAVERLPGDVDDDAVARFRSLLSQPARLGEMLRSLHAMGVLEKIIPEFEHARCLLQFNQYHKYTVDEHCFRAVEYSADLRLDQGLFGDIYRGLKRKWLLHLALLLHDLGKGFTEDHSEVGKRIAERNAARLRLSERDSNVLSFLVHKHLMMSHLAFRRDTGDERIVVQFAVECGSPEVLQMLLLLTASDLAAVGPGVLNPWKIEVLGELYQRAMRHLAGDAPASKTDQRLLDRRRRIMALLKDDGRPDWYERQLEAMPARYLLAGTVDEVAASLRELCTVAKRGVIARGKYLPDRGAVEFTVSTNEATAAGIFARLTGALTSQGLEILAAEINTLADGLVFDRFYVLDLDYTGEPPADRIDDVCKALRESLTDKADQPRFRRVWRAQQNLDDIPRLPTQVRVDNSTSDRYTILDVFAADRTGLLHTVTRTLFDAGLSVSVAKIGTYLDQVVDVFYVTDFQGRKIEDETQLQAIRKKLLEEIAAFEEAAMQNA
jgi:[protein-PII] uridylyltransferase